MNESWLDEIKWTEDGLVPVIAQDAQTGRVLMFAWMNRESLALTVARGEAVYYSRSRQKLWRKGESSGQIQILKEMSFDCDGDTILLKVDQTGPACHTGRRRCFYNVVRGERVEVASEALIDPEQLYGK